MNTEFKYFHNRYDMSINHKIMEFSKLIDSFW